MGVMYLSTHKLGFCSDNPLSYKEGDETKYSYYKLPTFQFLLLQYCFCGLVVLPLFTSHLLISLKFTYLRKLFSSLLLDLELKSIMVLLFLGTSHQEEISRSFFW